MYTGCAIIFLPRNMDITLPSMNYYNKASSR